MLGIVEIFASEGSDKTTDHSYELVYGPLLEDVIECGKRLLNPSLLEIGYLSGGGIRGFQRLFPGFRYYSLDLGFPTPVAHDVAPVFADTGSEDSLEAARRRMPSGRFALIVDDGSHDPEHQARALRTFWPLLAEGGIYVIEDVLIDRQPHLAPADCRSELIDLRSVKGRFDAVARVLRKFVDRSDLP